VTIATGAFVPLHLDHGIGAVCEVQPPDGLRGGQQLRDVKVLNIECEFLSLDFNGYSVAVKSVFFLDIL